MNTEPKKRGRKKGSTVVANTTTAIETPTVPKKRGRKPKGGKIIEDANKEFENEEVVSNVILHLKCSKNDIENSFTDNSILSHNLLSSKATDLSFQIVDTTESNNIITSHNDNNNMLKRNHININHYNNITTNNINITNINNINNHNMNNNNNNNKYS